MKQRLLQIIRDPMWQFVGIVIGAIIALVIFWFQQSHKELSYEIISSTPLFDIREEAQGKVEVFFDGKPIENAYLEIIRITNSGNEPIVRNDYEKPIQINFNKEITILSAEVIKDTEYSITTTIQVSQNRITLDPMLINPGETITLKVITNNYKEGIDIAARIAGLIKLEYKSPPDGRTWSDYIVMAGFFVAMFFNIKTLFSRKNKTQGQKDEIDQKLEEIDQSLKEVQKKIEASKARLG